MNTDNLFLTDSELAGAFTWVAANDLLFQSAPVFGVAGGPDAIGLTDAGKLLSYDLAAVYRFRITLADIWVLEQLAAVGELGVPVTSFAGKTHSAARKLDSMLDDSLAQASIAASLRGDQVEYDRLQDRGRLVRVEHALAIPTYRITSLGNELVGAARKVAEAMLEQRNQRHHHADQGEMEPDDDNSLEEACRPR